MCLIKGGKEMFICYRTWDDTIHRDEKELAEAEWFERGAMPAHDDGISQSGEMMGIFERNVRS